MNEPKKLYPHQRKALDITRDRNRVAYYLDMGLGKTITGIEKMLELGNMVNLIVCQKSTISMWREEVRSQLGQRVSWVAYDLTDKKQYNHFFSHVRSAQLRAMFNNYDYPIAIGIINYDIVHRRKEVMNLHDFTLMLDESSLIQNDTTKRNRAIQKMKVKNVILLSGTPVAGAYEKLYSQVRLLGWDITKTKFWDEFVSYINMPVGMINIKKVVGYKNVPKLKRKLLDLGCVFMKTEDVFELPQQNVIDIKVKNIKPYKEMVKEGLVTIDGTELLGNTPVTKMLRLRQICGIYNESKTRALLDILTGTEDRVIIFYNFTSELNYLKPQIEKLDKPTAIISGDIKKDEELERFRKLDNCVLFVQYQAGARGLNLQECNKIIYYTLPLSSELYEQSKKRTHRIGQDKPCFYYNLLVENSIEIDILERLKDKKDYTDALFIQKYGVGE